MLFILFLNRNYSQKWMMINISYQDLWSPGKLKKHPISPCFKKKERYQWISTDCPLDAEDFRVQQCSAYNDVQYQGCYYEWLPQYSDPATHCTLRCQAQGQNSVLDGTRCTTDSLDMCISGICQFQGYAADASPGNPFENHWFIGIDRFSEFSCQIHHLRPVGTMTYLLGN
ncbi:hypothetical protein FD755_018916 [Muntiacus reevesi]|uniref:ADAMTS cysteine-rich domain-containing protein n=1 Tax=Muntiacus reevesi TaxID=9886 RepID=A0A5N3X426_MUNRE|nr:hypothetical protein FD755_018916 [Muntiacus reevesi]